MKRQEFPIRRDVAIAAGVVILLLGALTMWRLNRPEPPMPTGPEHIRPDAEPPARVVRTRKRAPTPAPETDEDEPHLSTDLPPEDAALGPRERIVKGEEFFSTERWEEAWPYFATVVDQHPEDPLAAFALYKLAWIEWNTGDAEAALADLELAAEWLEDNGDKQSVLMANMVHQELDDLLTQHPGLREAQ